MAFTGKLGHIDSRPGNIILGGDAPAGGGPQIYDRSLESAITITHTAVSSIKSISADSPLSITQTAVTTVPWHVEATSALAFTITLGTSIKMLSASSPISLVSEAVSSLKEVSASSPISLDQTALPGLYKPAATSSISLTQEALIVGGLLITSANSPITLTQEATTPSPLNKSASSPISLTQSATGIGPFKPAASSELALTDSARANILMQQADSVLVLADEARKLETYFVSASSPIAITDLATGYNLHVSAVSTLELSDTADTKDKRRSAESPIALTSTAIAERIKQAVSVITLDQSASCNNIGLQANSALSLSHEARVVNIFAVSNASLIELTQTVTSNIKMLSITDTIDLQQFIGVLRPWHVSAASPLQTVTLVFDLATFSLIEQITGLDHSASATLIGPRSLTSILSFEQTAFAGHAKATGISKSAESILSLTQAAISKHFRESEPLVIPLSHEATATVSKVVKSELSTLGVQATVTVVRAITASNTIEIKQAVAFIFEQSDTLCTYSPFVGSSSDPNAPTPPPSTYPAAGVTPGFRLQYPAIGPITDQLILRAPNLGNLDRLAMTRINRETRGGTLIIYADPSWPKVETLLLSFSGLSQQEGQSLLTFMETYLGQEIRLIDWEDRLWKGVIVNPSDPVVPDGPGCKYTASFEFEGEKV